MDIYARCEKACKSEDSDDYGVGYCAARHNDAEGHWTDDFCARQAVLATECEICQEWEVIHKEIQEGESPERICHECYNTFELNPENPFGDVLFQEGVGVYFECDACFVLDSVYEFDEERV